MAEVTYVTREQLMRALDVKPSAYMREEVDAACRAGSRAVEGFCHRIFYPEALTRTFDYPRTGLGRGINVIYFDERALVQLDSVASDGASIPPVSVLLRPDGGGSADWIELDRNSPAGFSGGPQRAVSITGIWGYTDASAPAGVLAAGLTAGAVTLSLAVPQEAGAVLRVDDERMIVTGRRWVSSGQMGTIGGTKDATSFTVSDASTFSPGETLLIEAERMELVDVSGNTLIVRRATGGSVLAGHIAAAVMRETLHEVQRGALGTTAAGHLLGAAVTRWVPPSLVKELAQAYGEEIFLQRNAGYARTVGTGDSERQVGRGGIRALEERAGALYRRKARRRAV